MFYAWLEDEGEIAADPMAKMKPPAIPEQPVPVLPDEALRRLFAACAGKDFESRRDFERRLEDWDRQLREIEAGNGPIWTPGTSSPTTWPP